MIDVNAFPFQLLMHTWRSIDTSRINMNGLYLLKNSLPSDCLLADPAFEPLIIACTRYVQDFA